MGSLPLIQKLLDSSAACLEHCSTHHRTSFPFSAIATRLRSLKQTPANPSIDIDIYTPAHIALYSIFLAAEFGLMSEGPVDELRQVLMDEELEACRNRFLAGVAKMDGEEATAFDDIPQYCYHQLEELVQVWDENTVCTDTDKDKAVVVVTAIEGYTCDNTVAAAVPEVAVVLVDDTAEDKTGSIITTIPEKDMCEDVACGSAGFSHKGVTCETTAAAPELGVVCEGYSSEGMVYESVVPEGCTREDTVCNIVAAVVPVAVSADYTPKDTIEPVVYEFNTHKDTVCSTTVATFPAAGSVDYTPKDKARKPTIFELYAHKDTPSKIMAEVFPATASVSHTPKDIVCTPTFSDLNITKEEVCNVVVATFPVATSTYCIPKNTVCEPVVPATHTPCKNTAVVVLTPASANHTPKETLCTIAGFPAAASTDDTFKEMPCKPTASEIHTHKNTICKNTATIDPAAASAKHTFKDTVHESASFEPITPKEAICNITITSFPAAASAISELHIHKDTSYKTMATVPTNYITKDTVHESAPSESNTHKETVCNITVASPPAATSANHIANDTTRESVISELHNNAAMVPATVSEPYAYKVTPRKATATFIPPATI
ncbi:hypothetical protein Q9L58_004360 [Maublancomyces gigas]|uniref:Uncharacterized protein n=1 Tax=Discina gigas TaxID=1032678 RepID=A0ABR3GL62_9PEZI